MTDTNRKLVGDFTVFEMGITYPELPVFLNYVLRLDDSDMLMEQKELALYLGDLPDEVIATLESRLAAIHQQVQQVIQGTEDDESRFSPHLGFELDEDDPALCPIYAPDDTKPLTRHNGKMLRLWINDKGEIEHSFINQ